MKCNRCGKNEATMHFTQVINGHKEELYLCEICAQKDKPQIGNIINGFELNMDDFLGGFFTNESKTKPLMSNLENVCSYCGMTFTEFSQTGKFGCCGCYNSFKNRLVKPLKQIHGAVEHAGKIPSRMGGDIRNNRKIASLEAELNQAVLKQEFERAAQIRDQLKEIREKQEVE